MKIKMPHTANVAHATRKINIASGVKALQMLTNTVLVSMAWCFIRSQACGR